MPISNSRLKSRFTIISDNSRAKGISKLGIFIAPLGFQESEIIASSGSLEEKL